jgi:septal ring factor EnvC (AmiA/AmiB activator)
MRAAVAAIVVCVALMPGLGLAAKDKEDALSKKIERERRALEKIKEEIERKKRRAEEAERKKDTVLHGIEALDDRLQTKQQEHRDITRELVVKEHEIETIDAEALIVKVRLAERRGSLLARMRVQYMEGRFGQFKTLLSADNYESLQRRYFYLSAVSQREYALLQAYRDDLARLHAVEREAAEARDALAGVKQRTEAKVAEIQALKRDKKALLKRIIQQKESYERAAAELQRSAEQVDAFLQQLEQRRRAAAAKPKRERATLKPYRGLLQLQWPAEGEVVSFFGRQKHPSFETYVQRKGIEIRTEEGSPIRAVMGGTVAYADWLKGYGLVMIIDHGNGMFSLYAHASRLFAKVGQTVLAGRVIGEAGDTGLTGESTLYFELREGAEPIDPLAYLPKRR